MNNNPHQKLVDIQRTTMRERRRMTATKAPPTSNHNATTNGFETSEPVAGRVPTDTFRPKEACTVGLATTRVWLPSPMFVGNEA